MDNLFEDHFEEYEETEVVDEVTEDAPEGDLEESLEEENEEREEEGFYLDDEEEGNEDEEEDEEEGEEGNFDAALPIFEDLLTKGVLGGVEGKEYEPTEDGIRELIEDTIKSKTEEADIPEAIQGFMEFAKDAPNATIEDYINAKNPIDYSIVDHTNKEHAGYLVEDMLLAKGMGADDVSDMVALYNKKGNLEEKALEAKNYLIEASEAKLEAVKAKKQAEEAEYKAAMQKRNDDFRTKVLESDNIRGFALGDAKQRKDIYEYATKAVGPQGETQAQLDESLDDDILFLYIKKNKLSFNDLAKAAESKGTASFKKKVADAPRSSIKSAKVRKASKSNNNDFEMF